MATKKRVKVTVELEESTLWFLFNEAHKRDITLNEMVNITLKWYIAQIKKSKRLDGRS